MPVLLTRCIHTQIGETNLHPDDEICVDAIVIDAAAVHRREPPDCLPKFIMRLLHSYDSERRNFNQI